MEETHQWDLIWPSANHPINIDRNTTWHIDLTIPQNPHHNPIQTDTSIPGSCTGRSLLIPKSR